MEERCVRDLPFCEGWPILFPFQRGAWIPSSAQPWGVLTRPAFSHCYLISPWQGLDGLFLTSTWVQTRHRLRPVLSGIWITMKQARFLVFDPLCATGPHPGFVHHNERGVLASPPQSVDTQGLQSAFLFFLWPPLGGQNPRSVVLCKPHISKNSVFLS